MALSRPGNNHARFVRDAEPCLSPPPFSHLFPCEPSGSGGQKFICSSRCFANSPPAKSHVCWRKPRVSAQKCISKKERERRRRREAPEWLGSCLFVFQACGSGLVSAVHSPSQRCSVHSVGAICQTDGSARRHFQKKLEQGGRGRNKQPAGWHVPAHPLPALENPIPSTQNATKGFCAVHRSPAPGTTTHPCAPRPVLHTPSQPRRGPHLHQRHAGGRLWLGQPPSRCSPCPDGCRRDTTSPGFGFVASLPARPPAGPTLAEQLQVSDLLAHLELQDLLQDLLPLHLVSDAHALQLLPVQPQQRPTCKHGVAQRRGGDTVKVRPNGNPCSCGNKEGEREEIPKCSFTTWTHGDGGASQVAPLSETTGWQLEVPSLGTAAGSSSHVTHPRRQELSISPLHLPHQEMFFRAHGPRMGWPSRGNRGTHQNALALPPPSPASHSPPVQRLLDEGFTTSFCPCFPAYIC